MKKTLLAIFAHPDDEAFGPAGTLALLTKDYDVQLVIVTNGEHSHPSPNLDVIRKAEVEESAKIIGISKVHYLGFEDGTLNNHQYHQVIEKLTKAVEKIRPESLMTFEPLGFSGHLDHIAVTSAVNCLFHKFSFINKVYYHCLHETQRKHISEYFVFCPQGYTDEEISVSFDITEVWDKKLAAITAHKSQQSDKEFWVPIFQKCDLKEYFIVRSR